MVSEVEALRAENAKLKVKMARIRRVIDYDADDGCELWFWAKLVAALR